PELFQLVLQRYEDDYNRERPGLVRDVMSLLWAARRGLSESELLDLLGDGQQALPSAYWSPLHLAAEQSLIVRSGMLGFAHEYMRRAIQHRYLMEPEDRRAAHSHLAAYFSSRERDRRA